MPYHYNTLQPPAQNPPQRSPRAALSRHTALMARRTMSWLLAPVLLVAIATTPTYVAAYCCFALLATLLCFQAHRDTRLVFAFIALYLLVALLNISSWRGYIETDTIAMYALALYALHLPTALLPRHRRLVTPSLRTSPLVRSVLTVHLLIAYGCVAWIYRGFGAIALHQQLRFGIPAAALYTVTSCLPLAILAPFLFANKRTALGVAAASVLPTLLLGVRGSALVSLLGFVLGMMHTARSRRGLPATGKRKAFVLLGVASCCIIAFGFFARRSGNTELSAPKALAKAYFDQPDAWWVLPIMPVYLGVRETTGLTNLVITDRVTNDVNPTPLFFADLLTILPGQQLDAGQSMGRIFGTADAGGLTPGLLGGLFIDFREWALAWHFLAGGLLSLAASLAFRHPRIVPLYFLALVHFVHIFHRGFLKPEYFTSMVIAAFYLAFARGQRLNYTSGSRSATSNWGNRPATDVWPR